MTTASFTRSRTDDATIRKIAKRAARLYQDLYPCEKQPPQLHWAMTIAAAHANGCPLRLEALLEADDGNFGHDVFGLDRFIDKDSGVVPANKFWPRYARPDHAAQHKEA